MRRYLACLLVVLLFGVATSFAQEEILSVMGTDPMLEKVPVSDVSQLLSTAYDAAHSGTDPTWATVKSVFITCEDNDVRIAFGRAAAQGGSPMGHILYVGQSFRIPSGDLVRKAYIINKTNAAVGNLMITVEK